MTRGNSTLPVLLDLKTLRYIDSPLASALRASTLTLSFAEIQLEGVKKMPDDKQRTLERLKKAGIDTKKLSDKALPIVADLSDEELKQLAQIQKKHGTKIASVEGDTGGFIF
jgi:hypothetical protein